MYIVHLMFEHDSHQLIFGHHTIASGHASGAEQFVEEGIDTVPFRRETTVWRAVSVASIGNCALRLSGGPKGQRVENSIVHWCQTTK